MATRAKSSRSSSIVSADSTPEVEAIPKDQPSPAGEFVNACQLDLPKNDVIESIDFERFFRLNLRFNDLQGPATLDPGSMQESSGGGVRASSSQKATAGARPFRAVPFSSNKSEWKALTSGTQAANIRPSANNQNQNLPQSSSLINLGALSLALYLPFRQEWKLRGYSRGRLVNSFTLGPQEEQTVEIFKWDRMTRNMESTTSFESEESSESSSTRRDTNDVANDIARQTGFETNSQGKVGFQVGVVNADLSAGFNARTGVNEAVKETRNAIREATNRSTSRVRMSRTLKIVEGREYGQETRITRRLRNPNKCHTLTIAFMEILANYTVSTFVLTEAVRLVVLIDSTSLGALKQFDRATLRAHETPLRLALLDSSLADGIAAARYLDARERACGILCEGCHCGDEFGGQASGTEWNNLTAAAADLGAIIATLRGLIVFFPALIPLAAVPLPVPQAVTDIKRHLFRKSLKMFAPRLVDDLAGLGVGSAGSVTVSQVEAIYRIAGSIPPDALAKLVSDNGVATSTYWEIYGFVVSMITHDPISAFGVTEVVRVNCGFFSGFDDGGLVAAINRFRAAYENWKKIRQAQIDKDEKLAALKKIEAEERAMRVLEAYPLRETADAEERLDALLAHLNDARNLDHYRFAVWNERSGATDETLIGLALAGFIDPTPVGMVGDQLAVPVRMAPGSPLAKFFAASISDLVAHIVRDDQDHILPTPALYAESILGTCDSCEDAIDRENELDLKRMELNNQLLELEGARLKARVDSKQLDREVAPPAIRVEIAKNEVPA